MSGMANAWRQTCVNLMRRAEQLNTNKQANTVGVGGALAGTAMLSLIMMKVITVDNKAKRQMDSEFKKYGLND